MKKVKKGWLISQNTLAKITNFTSGAANFTDIPTNFTISLLLIAISIDIYPSKATNPQSNEKQLVEPIKPSLTPKLEQRSNHDNHEIPRHK